MVLHTFVYEIVYFPIKEYGIRNVDRFWGTKVPQNLLFRCDNLLGLFFLQVNCSVFKVTVSVLHYLVCSLYRIAYIILMTEFIYVH